MRQVISFVGGLLMLLGVAGLINEFVGWFRFFAVAQYVPALEGNEVVAYIGLIVVGFVVVLLTEHKARK
ncbi:hypothetical protein [Prauserella cavernicola]|uniref:Uncharacterized protein n=1 Tax=Prauserella cavernicola TaxID=2800127 RepID=A0A934QWQ9_9PSEU|nr:hypothetical protein [Prauserella cavernicola]MBK1787863.1 hypothetical protein [Prauserella cavernicola]